jgi:hypothetical protein
MRVNCELTARKDSREQMEYIAGALPAGYGYCYTEQMIAEFLSETF